MVAPSTLAARAAGAVVTKGQHVITAMRVRI
jgi:hypothetical protein